MLVFDRPGEMALALAEMALYATHVAGTLLHVLWERPEDMDVGCEWLLVYVRSSRVDCAGPASEHVVTLPLWEEHFKGFLNLPALSALSALPKAERGTPQLWETVHFREFTPALLLHFLHYLPPYPT